MPLKNHQPVEPRQHPAGSAAVQSRAAGKHRGKQAKKTQKSKISELVEGGRAAPSSRGAAPISWGPVQLTELAENKPSPLLASLSLPGWQTQRNQ